MGGFSDPSHSNDAAVEQILSEAKDACLLEQISAINCSAFTDSVLPAELESRFHSLKSFPVTKFNRSSSSGLNSHTRLDDSVKAQPDSAFVSDEKSFGFSPSNQSRNEPRLRSRGVSIPSDCAEENVNFSPMKETTDGKTAVKAKSVNENASSPSSSSISSVESSISPSYRKKSDKRKPSMPKSKSESVSSPLTSSKSVRASPSPPRRPGCFWCSPKKDSKKKNKDWATVLGFEWGRNDDLLSDWGTFSVEKQQRLLKKAMKEKEKINRELKKTLELAKQASARMSVVDSDDNLSDD